MTEVKIQCQKLHVATQTVWEFDYQVPDGSEADVKFQACENPLLIGAKYVGPFNVEVATPDHADVVWVNPEGI